MNNKTENHIRSFGMSGYLVTEEIKQIEEELNIDLGHVKGDIEEGESVYYPQFEQAVRAESKTTSGNAIRCGRRQLVGFRAHHPEYSYGSR
jgi:hypothetical protein